MESSNEVEIKYLPMSPGFDYFWMTLNEDREPYIIKNRSEEDRKKSNAARLDWENQQDREYLNSKIDLDKDKYNVDVE